MKHPLQNNVNFAIYARLSVDDEGEKEVSSSIDNQVKILERKLLEMNLECVDVYIDDGYSGKDMNRPGINKLVNDIYNGKINGIIVKDLSRVGRNLIEVGKFIEEFCVNNFVRFISVLDNFDSAYNEDDDSIVLKSFMNDLYLKECQRKSRKAYEVRRDKTLFIRHGRYGYDIVDGKFVINEEEAAIIRWIFCEYTSGRKTSEIIRILKANKVYGVGYLRYVKANRPLRNEDPYFWDFKSINRIIHDNTYIGEFTNLKASKYLETYTFQDAHEPIITKELFELAQNVCHKNKTERHDEYNKFIYDGINNRYFHVHKAVKAPRGTYKKTGLPRYKNLSAKFASDKFYLNFDATIEIILNETKEVLEELKKNRNYVLDLLLNINSEIKPKINKLKEEITRLEIKKKAVTTKYISGSIDKFAYQTEKLQVENKLLELNQELQQLEAKLSESNMSAYNNYVDNILSYDEVDFKLARLVFKRIVVTKDEENNPIFEFEYNVKA